MKWMLRLYPRGWRQRYGSEVEMLLAEERPSLRLFLDLLAGAVDARINPQWQPAPSPTKGNDAMSALRCQSKAQFSTAEQLRSAGVMLGASLAFTLLGVGLDAWSNDSILSKAVLHAAFPMAVIASSWNTFLSVYSRQVRWIIGLGGMLGMFLFMLAVNYFGTLI